MTATTLLKVDEFETMGLADRGNTWELVWGDVRQAPGSGFEHSGIGAAISDELRQFVRSRYLSRVTGADGIFILSREHKIVLLPNVAFVAKHRLLPTDRWRGFFDAPPDLAVEIVWPSDRIRDVEAKAQIWMRFGTGIVWVVDPSSQIIAVWTADGPPRLLSENDEIDGGEVLPGFRIAVAEFVR